MEGGGGGGGWRGDVEGGEGGEGEGVRGEVEAMVGEVRRRAEEGAAEAAAAMGEAEARHGAELEEALKALREEMVGQLRSVEAEHGVVVALHEEEVRALRESMGDMERRHGEEVEGARREVEAMVGDVKH